MEACLFLQVLSSLGPASHCVRRPEPPGRRPLLLAPGCPGLWGPACWAWAVQEHCSGTWGWESKNGRNSSQSGSYFQFY